MLQVHLEQVLGKQQAETWGLGSISAIFEGGEEKHVPEESHNEMRSNSLGKKFRFIFNFCFSQLCFKKRCRKFLQQCKPTLCSNDRACLISK